LELILESLREKDNSMGFLIVAKKLLPRMELKDCIKDLEFLSSVFSLTELFTSGNFKLIVRGYDAGKQFIWGTEQ
jgi:hypothetical protein